MATTTGTENYFKRLAHQNIPEQAIRTLGKTGVKVSGIGFGGYRVHHNSVEHAMALRYALLNGCNLIDTSSNYTDGGSEMLIGNLLQEMFERSELERDEVVVVSKVGYVQGQNLQLAQQAETDGKAFPDMVKYMDGCWHCIHPEFLEDQLSRALERLRLPALDIYLLHNPEYFLSDKKKHNGTDVQAARDEYYRRIKQAFAWLEEKVAEGRIMAYGISSNTFPAAANDFEFTSLEKVLEMAREVASDNYFKVIQFPFNLFEIGAVSEKNQASGSQTLLALAQEEGLATLVNRPLNAMYNGVMIRLASFRESHPKAIIDLFNSKQTTLQRLEKQFKDVFRAKVPEQVPAETLDTAFSLSKQLERALSAYQSLEHWDHVKQNVIVPQNLSLLSYLNHTLADEHGWPKWAESYTKALTDFLDAINRQYENEAQERSLQLSGKLKSLVEELANSATLSQQALRVLMSAPGIDCVLLGMRRTPYVEDALEALKAPAVPEAKNLLVELNAEEH